MLPAAGNEVDDPLCAIGAAEVGEREVGVIGREPREQRFVVLERPRGCVPGGAQVAQEPAHLLAELGLTVRVVTAHRGIEHRGQLSYGQPAHSHSTFNPSAGGWQTPQTSRPDPTTRQRLIWPAQRAGLTGSVTT